MKHRRLKVATQRKTNAELTTIHDRRATELPANALIAVGLRDDPYERGGKITVALSLRGDPLLSLHVRGMIADYQFAAGREWQRYFEMAQIDGMKSRAALDPVDGGGARLEFLTDAKRKAIAKLTYCRAILGETGNSLVTMVLGANMPLQSAALARGFVSKRDVEFCGRRFREALSDLAKAFGYA